MPMPMPPVGGMAVLEGAQPGRGRAALKADRIGFGAGLKQPLPLAEPDPDQFRNVLLSHARRGPAITETVFFRTWPAVGQQASRP